MLKVKILYKTKNNPQATANQKIFDVEFSITQFWTNEISLWITQLNVTDRETKHVLSLDMTQLLKTETEIIYPPSCRSKPGLLSFFHTMKVDGGQEL